MAEPAARIDREEGSPPGHSEKLLAAAAELFRAKGYAGSTTRELASLMGIQKASLYHHMARKEDLLYELISTSLERALRRADAIVTSEGPAIERLRAFTLGHVVSALEERDTFATMLIELRALTGERRNEVLRMRDAYEHRVVGLVKAAQSEGTVRSDFGAEEMVRVLLGTLNYPVFWFNPEGRMTVKRVAKLVSDVALEGMAAGPAKR
jgi:AcrR family transcriptional regulator